jgi:hypothetical protein
MRESKTSQPTITEELPHISEEGKKLKSLFKVNTDFSRRARRTKTFATVISKPNRRGRN